MNKEQLNYVNGIAGHELIEYLISKHELRQSAPGAGAPVIFSIMMLEQVIEYGTEHKAGTKDALLYFLADIIPELTEQEAAAFIEDALLTDYSKEAKEQFWNTQESAGKYFYYLECPDAIMGGQYFTATDINRLTTGENCPMSEKDIIKTAVNYEAELTRYERDPAGQFINPVCLYECEV